MTDYKNLIPKLIARTDDPDALVDAFGLCRELELDGSVRVEGRGRRDHGVTVYDEKGNRKMSSSSPAGHTAEWLKRLVDELPDVIRELLEEQCKADAEEDSE